MSSRSSLVDGFPCRRIYTRRPPPMLLDIDEGCTSGRAPAKRSWHPWLSRSCRIAANALNKSTSSICRGLPSRSQYLSHQGASLETSTRESLSVPSARRPLTLSVLVMGNVTEIQRRHVVVASRNAADSIWADTTGYRELHILSVGAFFPESRVHADRIGRSSDGIHVGSRR